MDFGWTGPLTGGYTPGGSGNPRRSLLRDAIKPPDDTYSSPFNIERGLASAAVFGSARHSQRGAEAQLEQRGLGGIPGVQSAIASQSREQNLTHLGGMYNQIGEREGQYIRLQNALSEAKRKEKEAKSEAEREQWRTVITGIVGAVATLGATALLGPAGGMIVGSGMGMLNNPKNVNKYSPSSAGGQYNWQSNISPYYGGSGLGGIQGQGFGVPKRNWNYNDNQYGGL